MGKCGGSGLGDIGQLIPAHIVHNQNTQCRENEQSQYNVWDMLGYKVDHEHTEEYGEKEQDDAFGGQDVVFAEEQAIGGR